MSVCFICGKSLTVERTVEVRKGMRSLLRASITRGEKQHEILLRSSDCIRVHLRCRKHYTNKHQVNAARKRRLLRAILASSPPPSVSPSSPLLEAEEFDFATKCFICTEIIPEDFEPHNDEHALDQGSIVHTVKIFSKLKSTILPYLEDRHDKEARGIVKRIRNVSDTDAAGAKYHRQCIIQLNNPSSTETKRGNPSKGMTKVLQTIYGYIANSGNCLFKISQLINQIEKDYRPDLGALKYHLRKKYGEDIFIFDYGDNDAFICFKNPPHRVLSTPRIENGRADGEEERLRVVREAAAIILEDIRSQLYETVTHPPLEDFMKDVNSVVPKSLRLLLTEVIIKPKRGSFEKWEKKCTAIAHAIISAVRPRSFFSTLQMGVGSFFYKKFGSRHFIDLLSALGFCSTYKEISAFESSCVQRRQPSDQEFSQFVFDNADFNVNTRDGHGTIHEIGEIHYVTPSNAIDRDQTKPCISKKHSTSVLGSFGTVSLSNNSLVNLSPTQNLFVANLDRIRPISHIILPTFCDLMWLYAKWSRLQNIAGWNGFADEAVTDKSFVTSKILCVNPPPSDDSGIYMTLVSAVEKCKAANQRACIVTFDLHLYNRAHQLVDNADLSSPIKYVILKLGGFHLITSFLGSIGYIMAGSGLEHIFELISDAKSVDKFMSGHAFSEAIRGHILIHLVLAQQIINSIKLTDSERKEIDSVISTTERSTILTPADKIVIRNIAAKFEGELRKLEERGPTAKLWLQYFRMVTLVKQFIEAERSGDWKLHLDTIQRMLPYFHASGKFLYGTAAHLYIQDMAILHEKIPAHEYEQFTKNGYFTIRRTHRFWSGIMADISMEHSLIRSIKTAGGLAQERGIFDSVLNKWTMGLVFLQKVREQLENFCGISSASAEQNVDTRRSQITNDSDDVEKIDKWLAQHPPFPKCTELRSISTGVVGDSSINCHLSGDIGANMINCLIGKKFHSLNSKQPDKVLPLATLSSGIRVEKAIIPIDPLLIFQRICLVKEARTDLRNHLEYELAPYPLALFSDKGMLKGTKSSMYNCFTPLPHNPVLWFNVIEIVDGEFLLHRVVWDLNVPFSNICEKYTKYLRDNFGPDATIIFDGYPDNVDNSEPESAEQSEESSSSTVVIDKTTICVTSQEKFLANKGNKARFVDILKTELDQSGFTVKQAVAKANTMILKTAIHMSPKFNSVVIVGEDVDLLVLLTGLGHQYANIFFRKPGNGSISEQLYKPRCLKYGQAVRDNILFLHAFSGCDTTSALHDMGKDKFLSTLEKNEHLLTAVELFREKGIDGNLIAQAGERFFIALYGGRKSENSINLLRFKLFRKLGTKNELSLSALPPTKNAAWFHSLRTYHQVQTWLGIDQNPRKWGWKTTTYGLQPIQHELAPAPASLLRLISCKCKDDCVTTCGCRKAGLKCCIICSNHSGHLCENQPNLLDIVEDDENDTDDEESEEMSDQISDEECGETEVRVTLVEENQPTSSKRARRE